MVTQSDIIHPFSFFSGSAHARLFLSRAGQRSDNFEYEVINDEDHVVGRIYFDEQAEGRRWFWEIGGRLRGESRSTGSAESLHDAKIGFALALDRLSHAR
jgi:hypothetical protein